MIKKTLAKLLVLCMALSTILSCFSGMSVTAAGTSAYQVVADLTVSETGANGKTVSLVTTPPATTITNPKGVFLKINASSFTEDYLEFALQIKADGTRMGQHELSYQKVFVSNDGTVTRGVITSGFSGYVFIPYSTGTDNLDMNMANIQQISLAMLWYGTSWDYPVTIDISKVGYYSVSTADGDDTLYQDIIDGIETPAPQISYDYEVIGTNTVTGTGADYGTIDYMTSVPAPAIANPKGIFLRVVSSGNEGLDEFSILYNGVNVFAGDALRFGSAGGTDPYLKIFISDNGTRYDNVLPANFSGYAFIPATTGTTNGNLNFTLNKIGFAMFPYATQWNNRSSTITISKAGYYYVDTYDNTQNYQNIVSEVSKTFDYEVISESTVTGSGADYGTIDYMTTVPASTLRNPKGIFLRINASGNQGDDEFSILYNGVNVFAGDALRFGSASGTNPYLKIFISDNGTRYNNLLPANFSGYAFIPATTGTTNGNLDFTLNKIGIAMFPYVTQWNDRSSTITISKAGYYFVDTYDNTSNYQGIVTAIKAAEPIPYDYQVASENYVSSLGQPYKTVDYVTTAPSAAIAHPKGIFFKLKVPAFTQSYLEFRVIIDSAGNAFGGHSGGFRKVFVKNDGTVLDAAGGVMPSGFDGYVFIPWSNGGGNTGLPNANADMDMTKIKKISIIMDTYGDNTAWDSSINLEITKAGYYSTSDYSSSSNYSSIVSEINQSSQVTYSYEVASTSKVEFYGSSYATAYLTNPIKSMTISEPKGVFFKIDVTGASTRLDFAVDLNDAPYPDAGAYHIGNAANQEKKIYVAADGTVTRGFMPQNFKGYVFVPQDYATNATIPADKIKAIGIMMGIWGDLNWNGVIATGSNSGLYNVSSYAGDDQYKALADEIEESVRVKHAVINDFETADQRSEAIGSSGDIACGYTGTQALSGNGSAMVKVNATDWSADYIARNITVPALDNIKGVFFRMKSNAPAQAYNFNVALGSGPLDFNIGFGYQNKVFVAMDGTVTRNNWMPENFDGYVFVAYNLAENTSIDSSQIKNVAILQNNWDGLSLWTGITSFFDNVGVYTVNSSAADSEYLNIVDALKAECGDNSIKSFYLTNGTGNIVPSNMARGIIGNNTDLNVVSNTSAAAPAVNFSVVSGEATITSTASGCKVKVTGGTTVKIKAALASDESQYVTYDYYVQKLGDTDFNDKVDIIDLINVRNHIINKKLLTGDNLNNANMAQSGTLSILDILLLKDKLLEAKPVITNYNTNTDWMKDSKYGIMVHYLESIVNNQYNEASMGQQTSWNECVNAFDVNKFANDVEKTGAGYVVFTVLQGSKYMIAPNATYNSYTGYAPGEACSERDLIADLYTALNAKGIKLMLYFTADGPRLDSQASTGLSNDGTANETYRQKWQAVAKEYSLRYGDKIAGWWVDGAHYGEYRYSDVNLTSFANDLKAGNPNAIVSFNPGNAEMNVRYYTAADDFTAGERNEFLSQIPTDRFLTGGQTTGNYKKQWHVLSFLGSNWGTFNLNYTANELTEYVQSTSSAGGAVTFELGVYRDGSLSVAQKEAMAEMSTFISK